MCIVAPALFLLLSVGASPLFGQDMSGPLSPSDVHQHARWVMDEIRLIREHEGVTEEPRDPGTQVNKLPIHAYQKAVELMDKVRRYQVDLGMEPLEVASLPFEPLSPDVVLAAVDVSLENLRAVKEELGVEEQAPEPEFITGRTPTQVYELLWRASYMMDGLTEATRPSDVFAKQKQVVADLEVVADVLDVGLPSDSKAYEGKEPRDVLMENYVNMYKLARLQRALGMDPYYVPPLPGGELTPSNVYDTAGTLIGELHRIKREFAREVPTPPLQRVEGKAPSDVYAEAKRVQAGLDALLQAVSAESP